MMDFCSESTYMEIILQFKELSKQYTKNDHCEDNDVGRDSFIHVKERHEEVKKHCGNILVVLFANKVDLVNENDLDMTKIQSIVNEHDFLGFYLISAKTGQGVVKVFNTIISELYQKFKLLSLD